MKRYYKKLKKVVMGIFYFMPVWTLLWVIIRIFDQRLYTLYFLLLATFLTGIVSALTSIVFGFRIIFILHEASRVTRGGKAKFSARKVNKNNNNKKKNNKNKNNKKTTKTTKTTTK